MQRLDKMFEKRYFPICFNIFFEIFKIAIFFVRLMQLLQLVGHMCAIQSLCFISVVGSAHADIGSLKQLSCKLAKIQLLLYYGKRSFVCTFSICFGQPHAELSRKKMKMKIKLFLCHCCIFFFGT